MTRVQRLALAASIVGSAIAFLDSSVVNVALPALRRDLGAGLAAQQWVVEGYLLSLGALVLVGGALGDLYGRRRVFAAGTAGFGAASLLCAAAPSAGALIAARLVQGIAGALLVPSSLAVISSTFAEPEQRGRAIGSWTAWTGAVVAAGPFLGGLLVDTLSWRWVFALNLPLVALTLALVRAGVPESTEPEHPGVDAVGGGLCTLGLAGPVLALVEQPTHGWGDPLVAAPGLGGLALLAAFVAWERRSPRPMLPLGLFRSRTFAVGNLSTFAVYAGLGGGVFLISLFVQQVAGWSAVAAGVTLAPVTLVILLLSRRFGGLAERLGPRAFMGAGPVVAGTGLLLLIGVGRHPRYASDVLPGVLVFGLGMAMTVAPLTSAVLGAVEAGHAGIASGVNNAVARVGSLVAIAVVGTVVSARAHAVLDAHLSGRALSAPARAAVARAGTRPLGGAIALGGLSSGERRLVDDARGAAALGGFRAGMLVSGLLVICGGIVSGVGIESRRRPAAVLRPQGGGAASLAPCPPALPPPTAGSPRSPSARSA